MSEQGGEFVWPVRVYYEDTDAGGVVYHSRYLNFMERARSEWLRALGFEQDELLERHRLAFAVRAMEVEFLRPARFNDHLAVSVAVDRLGRASLHFLQEVRRGGEVLCRARVKVGAIDGDRFRPTAMPAAIHAELKHATPG